jgi:hypothetical protein
LCLSDARFQGFHFPIGLHHAFNLGWLTTFCRILLLYDFCNIMYIPPISGVCETFPGHPASNQMGVVYGNKFYGV